MKSPGTNVHRVQGPFLILPSVWREKSLYLNAMVTQWYGAMGARLIKWTNEHLTSKLGRFAREQFGKQIIIGYYIRRLIMWVEVII